MLEIGSAWGYFLYQAKEYGFEATGIEIDARLSSFGKEKLGVAIVPGFGELKGGPFDVAVLVHSLEHFTDLSRVFLDLRDHLKPGGHLFIAVPHFDWRRFGDENLSVIGAVHPLGFSPEFFTRNLPRYKFSIQGFYSRAADFPHAPCQVLTQEGILVWARRD